MRNPRLNAVHEDVRAPIRLLEVEDQPLALADVGRESAPVPEGILRGERAPDARERALDSERDENLALPLGRTIPRVPRVPGDGVLPQPVQVRPVLADELRTRLFAPGVLRRDLCAPFGPNRAWCLHIRRMGCGNNANRKKGWQNGFHAI